jgi:hypothetical protein
VRRRLAVVALATGLLWAASAPAHQRSVSYSSWYLDDSGARVALRIAQLELTRLPWGHVRGAELDPRLGSYLTGRLRLLAGAVPCEVARGPVVLASAAGEAAVEWRVECPAPGPREIRSELLLEVAPSHLHFARVHDATGGRLERVLTAGDPGWPLAGEADGPTSTPVGSSLGAYVLLGIEHIWTGWDHLAFVLALILIAARVGEVATVVTGFTLAHSLTLGLAVLGFVRPEMQAIEALIGLSIGLVAVENLWLVGGRPRAVPWLLTAGLGLTALLAALGIGGVGALTLAGIALFSACYLGLVERLERPARLRVAIAFAFGLIHGFGFAGVLAEMELPTERLASALFGFNLGVEVGQLVVVSLLWPALGVLARLRAGSVHRLVVEAGSAAVCSLGLFWFLTRAFD